ncbi:MAG TPA: DUF3348 domain-containing protein [Paraburkholderia sp.]|jgi:hypothetical protein|nr:DUF3348 domain-containing protein [Paraburkholderia sp.]
MVQTPQRTAAGGPTLVRLLARLAQAEVAEPRQSLSDRLADWLGWTDAITLSSALKNSASAPHAGARGASPNVANDADALGERVRASLARSIALTTRGPAARTRHHATPAEPPPDYADFRQRYQSMQQTMDSDIADLRQRLRVMLAAASPGMARLATVDAVMERSLGAHERSLLASVPTLLGAHFERLRRAAQPTADDDDATTAAAAAPSGAWLRTFVNDMESVLLAELEVRFQPVEGLLAALRAR